MTMVFWGDFFWDLLNNESSDDEYFAYSPEPYVNIYDDDDDEEMDEE